MVDAAKVRAAVEAAMRENATKAVVELQATASTWTHKPSFEVVVTSEGVVVGTDHEIYEYVDQGTKPHTIRPRKAKRLKFMAGGSAKTSPGVIGSRSGQKGGQGPIYAMQVRHPGIAARGFTTKIAAKRQQELAELVNNAIRGVL